MPSTVSRNLKIWMLQREAIVTVAYQDGRRPDMSVKWSIGAGSQDPPPKEGDTITIHEAIARFNANIASREVWLNKKLTVDLTQQQFDAFLSVAYRAGSKPVKVIGDLFNAGEPIFAISKIIEFVSAGGAPNKGLIKRAIREMAIAELGYYGDLTLIPVYDGDPNITPRRMVNVATLEGI